MPSIKIKIAPAVLDWILGVASSEGADSAVLSLFRQWKSGVKIPTFAQIEDFGKKAHVPLGYFFLKTPPDEPIPIMDCRTIGSTAKTRPSRSLMDTYYQMASIQEWMRDYLIDNGRGKLPFAGSAKKEKNPAKIAASIRSVTGMADDWYTGIETTAFNAVRTFLEDIGILVLQNGIVGENTHRPLRLDEFRAFTLADDYAPLVFINSNDTEGGKVFSLLHEAAHIWLGLHSFYNDNSGLVFNISPLETLCNATAAELLVPGRSFIDEWNRRENQNVRDKIKAVARCFKCGVTTVARRALDNGYIEYNEYQKIVIDQAGGAVARKKASGKGDYYKTARSRYGEPLILALDNSIKTGKTTYTEAFRLANKTRETFDTLVSKIRGGVW
ncbi:MAG: ImmA/IrrE family metallo-endopeptidase [Spirochaetaceae bacterium]|jgi:Zn-dependent peptidase ImmA (M78 family)|nr:ImmA/IrrE family metallo-endopeptidase [Spirochaetaceae bacterium]